VQNVDQIEKLQERLRKLKARQAIVEAQQRTLESRRARKADTRRKILVGAIVLAKVDQGAMPQNQLREWLDASPHRSDDRELFGLQNTSTSNLVRQAVRD
jgi:hypothetical protein